jgi:hypothetical protein
MPFEICEIRSWAGSVREFLARSPSLDSSSCCDHTFDSALTRDDNRSSEGLQCTKCPGFIYLLADEFREHSRSSWHQYNLRLPIGQALSFEKWCEVGDGESHSSSDESLMTVENESKPDIILVNGLSFRVLEDSPVAFPAVLGDPRVLLTATYVCVMLLRAGRFAGAVWDIDGNIVTHTSFKRYTTRRKNGGSQSKNDKSKGSPAQSVGAQIRREQEKRLADDVFDLVMNKWTRYLADRNSLVFAYASKSLSDELFVGPLTRSAPSCHLLKIPLSVRNPTFSEVCRVYKTLTQFVIVKQVV